MAFTSEQARGSCPEGSTKFVPSADQNSVNMVFVCHINEGARPRGRNSAVVPTSDG